MPLRGCWHNKHGIRFNEQVCHPGGSNECGGFSCVEAFRLGCSLASHMHSRLKLPIRMETGLCKWLAKVETQNLLHGSMVHIPPCGGCSWGSFSGIEWTIPQLTINAAGKGTSHYYLSSWVKIVYQRLILLFEAVAVFILFYGHLLYLQPACFTS
jgi:hypothetical protein